MCHIRVHVLLVLQDTGIKPRANIMYHILNDRAWNKGKTSIGGRKRGGGGGGGISHDAQIKKQSHAVANKLVDEMLCCFSPPEQVHSDQGCQFELQVVRKLLKIEKTRTTPYHPQ